MALTQPAEMGLRTVDPQLLLMHQVMVGDRTRLQAYDRALARTVNPGDVVADVGAGTLILSMLALRHGAKHVYAIEADPETVAVAQRVAERNNLMGRLTLVQGDARSVVLPERVDVLVSEMMGNLGPEEEMAEIVGAVARRNLRPGGRVVPEQLVTQLQGIEFDDEGWGVWRDDFWGYSLSPVQECASAGAQLHFFSRAPTLLSPPVVISNHRLGEAVQSEPVQRQLPVSTSGNLQAVIGYFSVTLAPGVTLSNFPSYPGCNWAVWIWPLRHTAVAAGDVIHVEMECPPYVRAATSWRLACSIARGGGSS